MALFILAPAIVAVLVLIGALLGARSVTELEVAGTVGFFCLAFEDLVLRALIGWGEAWSGSGGGSFVLRYEVVSAAVLVLFFTLATVKAHRWVKRRPPGKGRKM
jgi:hypothetical protein